MSEKPKKGKWGIGKRILVAILALVALLGVLVMLSIAMALVGTYFSSTPVYELEGAEAQDFIEARFFALPEDASDVYLYYFSVYDVETYIRFSAGPEAIESWLSGLEVCFKPLVNHHQLYNTRGEILAWWTPQGSHSNADIPRCEAISNTVYLTTRQIIIDEGDSDLWIVYIAIFGS